MTCITRLTLQGFKSFNKKISIPLLRGFNIICGPNGSGKSNIVDSVCFVLGRISAKSLRAERLHELIFHGGNGKAPAQYASVTLYLDNSNKEFPFDEPEVSITRKVNRKGVSVYKLQGRTTTREKILEILSSARIRPDGHNIILQGDVTNIIEMNPIERRFIIDEISGIAEYNDKKEKAQRELEVVDQKLKEAEIIITERYEIFKRLEEERNAAIKYQTLQKQLQALKASLILRKIKNFEEMNKTLEQEIGKEEEENKKLQEELEKIEEELEKKEKGIRELADKLIKISKKVEIEKEISYTRTKILFNKDKLDSNLKEIERIENLIEKLKTFEVKEEFSEVPTTVKAILNLNLKGVLGVLRNLIKTTKEYQLAIEIAAGPHLNDIVVENDEVASYCIDYLKREKIGRATFIPLNKIKWVKLDEKTFKIKGIIGPASKVVKCDSKILPAIEFVFGNTLLVENLEVARALGIGKVRMVTLDGDLIERSGAMTGGYLLRKHPKILAETAKEEVEEYIKLKKKLQEDNENLKKEIKELEEKLKKYSQAEETKEIISIEKIKVDSEVELDKLRNERKKVYEKRISLQTKLNKLRIQKAKVEAELETLRVEALQYGEIKPIEKGIKVLEEAIEQTVKELNSLGAVNFKAIEQYEKFKTEFDEYKMKYEKILEEKKAVLEMIEKIEEKRREVFNKCLKELSEKFNEIFKKMTGGSASLELENPLDLESGLIIQANPGGKTLLNIDSLSGGEKTLTALAFIFAIQSYKPAPFYILDEIDAALDKENSKKVSELIKSFSKEAQFIVITHNDQTIKYGDRVYGVTMDKGESKILGLEMPG
ncbi:MAG: AAA family ATPase [Candidatus Aenigmatarchaeota archaeon]